MRTSVLLSVISFVCVSTFSWNCSNPREWDGDYAVVVQHLKQPSLSRCSSLLPAGKILAQTWGVFGMAYALTTDSLPYEHKVAYCTTIMSLLAGQALSKRCNGLNEAPDPVENSAHALRFAQATYKKFDQGMRPIHFLPTLQEKLRAVDALTEECAHTCPYFLMDECVLMTDRSPCTYSRLHYPDVRETFTENAVEKIGALVDQKAEGPFVCTSFGSGDLFTDYGIWVKACKNKPNLNLVAHVIDSVYQPYLIARAGAGIEGSVVHADEQTLGVSTEQSVLFMRVMNMLGGNGNLSYGEHMIGVKIRQNVFKQVVNLFNRACPESSLRIHVHSSGEQYLSELSSQGNSGHPRMCMAVDIDDDGSIEQGAPRMYRKLCRAALKNHPLHFADNLMVGRDKNKNLVLRTIQRNS